MKKFLLLSSIAIFALANDKVLIDSDLNQVCSTEKCENLSNKFEKVLNSNLDKKRENRKDLTGNSVSKLKGEWSISYGFGNSKSYSDSWNLTETEYTSYDVGYSIKGTNKNGNEVGCSDLTHFEISGGYEYMCVIVESSTYVDWFFVNLNGNSLSGKYEYGSADDFADAGAYGNYDGSISGSRNSNTQSNTNLPTSSSEYYSDLANTKNKIGWYFWTTPSGKAYLANGRDSGDIAIWNFTDEKKWKPIHNANAFDGYSSAGKIFNKVTISSDGKYIDIE